GATWTPSPTSPCQRARLPRAGALPEPTGASASWTCAHSSMKRGVPASPVQRQQLADRVEHLLRLDRLDEVGARAQREGALSILVRGFGRQDHDGDPVVPALPQVMDEL